MEVDAPAAIADILSSSSAEFSSKLSERTILTLDSIADELPLIDSPNLTNKQNK